MTTTKKRQLSGAPRRGYMSRFDLTARALENLLDELGYRTQIDGTHMAYEVVHKLGTERLAGPASCQEEAMSEAVYKIIRDKLPLERRSMLNTGPTHCTTQGTAPGTLLRSPPP